MNEFVERSPGGKLFHSCEHPPFSILRCITTLRLLAGVRDGNTLTSAVAKGCTSGDNQKCTTDPVYEVH